LFGKGIRGQAVFQDLKKEDKLAVRRGFEGFF
jgi:hypothetical protein